MNHVKVIFGDALFRKKLNTENFQCSLIADVLVSPLVANNLRRRATTQKQPNGRSDDELPFHPFTGWFTHRPCVSFGGYSLPSMWLISDATPMNSKGFVG